MKIIIAEDNPVILNLYKIALKNTGYDLILTKNGTEALKRLNETKAQMVITDWEMPEMDGLSLCRYIREQDNTPYVYIIFVSSHDRQNDAIKGLDAGADDYIKKPFNPDELISRIKAGERIIELEDKFKKAYGNLIHAEKMASIGRLAAGIAHEINNPAGFILSNLDIMSEYQQDIVKIIKHCEELVSCITDEDNTNVPDNIKMMAAKIKSEKDKIDIDFILEDTKDLLSENKKGILKITALVKELRAFVHPGEQKIKTVDLNEEIKAVLNIIQHDIEFKKPVSANLGDIPHIACNPAEMNQVFYGLLSNAAKATEEKGRIRISTKTDNGNIVIMISDTGKGIEKENLSRIFDPFFTTGDIDKGRGMSLNAAYNIVKNHGGIIDVKSDIGKGSVFSVILPINKEDKTDSDK